MKIGIFGDSFACKNMRTHTRYEGHPGFENIGKPWFEYLPYDITSFGVTGSDIYYSYNLYLKNRHRFDKTIFISTSTNRLSVKDLDENYLHYNSHVIAEAHKNRTKGDEADFLESVIRYFKHILDTNKDEIIFNLITDDIKKDKNCLLINGFGDNGLVEIFQMENKAWDIKFKDNHDPGIKDFRYCHMTEENNQIFAKAVGSWLSNNTDYNLQVKDFVKPQAIDKNRYIFNTEDLEVWLGDKNDRKNQ
jgi:hypothetical protein